MEYRVKEYSIFEVGQRKDAQGLPQQEDCIYPPCGADVVAVHLYVVCDGMGGHDAGEVASATVCEAISRYVLSHGGADGAFSNEELQGAISAAYAALDAKDTGAEKKMGTTMALLKLHTDGYTVAHIGDSRVYHFRPGTTADDTKIMFRTEDHSLVNYMLRTGQMTPEEAAASPKRHVITRAMQPNMERRSKADVYRSADVAAGDYFLLCTDGICENLDDDYLRYLFSEDGGSDKNKVSQLAKATANNRDNHSAIIVHVTEVSDAGSRVPTDALKRLGRKRRADDEAEADDKKPKIKESDMKKVKDGTLELLIKFLFLLIGVLALVMVVYYLFIRSDEDLQRAGTAVDLPSQQAADETYGYEITKQDLINEAQQIAPDFAEPEEEELPQAGETAEDEQHQETPAEEPEPINTADLLQE